MNIFVQVALILVLVDIARELRKIHHYRGACWAEIERMKKEVNTKEFALDTAVSRFTAAEEQVTTLMDALEKYADTNNWKQSVNWQGIVGQNPSNIFVGEYQGRQIARATIDAVLEANRIR